MTLEEQIDWILEGIGMPSSDAEKCVFIDILASLKELQGLRERDGGCSLAEINNGNDTGR